MEKTRKEHWDNIYLTKESNEVSWTQRYPKHSIELIERLQLPKTAKIIDIGGGDSYLVDALLDLGYTNVSVLDISEHAIERAKKRLNERASIVTWIVSDVLNFQSDEQYDCWHDRATFHFLIQHEEIEKYTQLLKKSVTKGCVISTFSTDGPKKCSMLDIQQYNQNQLEQILNPAFQLEVSFTDNHQTPFNTSQNFLYCLFKRF